MTATLPLHPGPAPAPPQGPGQELRARRDAIRQGMGPIAWFRATRPLLTEAARATMQLTGTAFPKPTSSGSAARMPQRIRPSPGPGRPGRHRAGRPGTRSHGSATGARPPDFDRLRGGVCIPFRADRTAVLRRRALPAADDPPAAGGPPRVDLRKERQGPGDGPPGGALLRAFPRNLAVRERELPGRPPDAELLHPRRRSAPDLFEVADAEGIREDVSRAFRFDTAPLTARVEGALRESLSRIEAEIAG